MAQLYLLRHAKAGWAAPGMADIDRPLVASGLADAAALGRRMHEAGLVPDRACVSPAMRTRLTWDEVAHELDRHIPTDCPPDLYDGDARLYLAAIRARGDASGLIVVGHNPIMEDLTTALARAASAGAPRVEAGFPTCGLAIFEVPGSLGDIRLGSCELVAFWKPGDK